MADAPWRCSECGTINEPVANACRTCGRWPSLFDLQESTVNEFDEAGDADAETSPAPQAFEPEVEEEVASEPEERGEPAEPESQSARRRRLLRRFIVPLAVVIYLVISNIVNR